MCMPLVTVRAVRYVAGGQVQTHHGSVTQEKTSNEQQCMSHSSQKINISCTCIMTGQHDTCCAPNASGKLCTHIKHARMIKGGGGPKKPHNPLIPLHEVQLLANTTYSIHITSHTLSSQHAAVAGWLQRQAANWEGFGSGPSII